MAAYVKVSKRGSILVTDHVTKQRRMIESGTRLDKDYCLAQFGQKEIDRLVSQGYLVMLEQQIDPEEHVAAPGVNERQQNAPHPHEVEKTGMRVGDRTGRLRQDDVEDVRKHAKVVVGDGPWDADPAMLAGKSVEELNVMIVERTPPGMQAEAFETPEEASAWLSQNYSAPKTQVVVG